MHRGDKSRYVFNPHKIFIIFYYNYDNVTLIEFLLSFKYVFTNAGFI